jgi:DNA replication initiation complex subunit (GINS family)
VRSIMAPSSTCLGGLHTRKQTRKNHLRLPLSSDLAQELEELRIEKRVWERERKFYDTWFATLEKERASVIPQIADLNKTVGYLEAKNENLEEEKQRLLTTPTQNTQRFIEHVPRRKDESTDDIPEGETADVVTD